MGTHVWVRLMGTDRDSERVCGTCWFGSLGSQRQEPGSACGLEPLGGEQARECGGRQGGRVSSAVARHRPRATRDLVGTRVSPALSWSPSPHLFKTICNHQSRILCVPKVRQLEWGTHTCSPNGSGWADDTGRGGIPGVQGEEQIGVNGGSALGPRGRRVGISPFQEEEWGGPARGRPPSACARVSSPAGRRAPPSGVE